MRNPDKTLESVGGTVFLYCASGDDAVASLFADAAERTGRRTLRREDCRALDPAALAGTPGKKLIFTAPSMTDFLDRYLEACPGGQRHLLIHARGAREAVRSMSFLFHDFWEERQVTIEDLPVEAGLTDE